MDGVFVYTYSGIRIGVKKKMAPGKERKKARGFDDCYPFSYPFAILFKLHFKGKHE